MNYQKNNDKPVESIIHIEEEILRKKYLFFCKIA